MTKKERRNHRWYLVATDASEFPAALAAHAAGDAHGGDTAGLGDHDVTVLVLRGVVVQDILRYLGRLSTTCRPFDHRHLI